jgi:uncharacterized protein YbcI
MTDGCLVGGRARVRPQRPQAGAGLVRGLCTEPAVFTHSRAEMTASENARARDGDVKVAISNAVVKHWRARLGRGPTKARTSIHGNIIVCVMQDTLTHAEQSLAQSNESEMIKATRRSHHYAMRNELAQTVEELVGAQVDAVMADDHINPDYSVQIFVLDRSL